MPTSHTLPQFCGNPITPEQLALIQKTTERYSNLSRTELAATLSEWLDWVRPNGKPKTVECRQFLDKLEQQQQITLPQKREKAAKRNAVAINLAGNTPQATVDLSLDQLSILTITVVSTRSGRDLWRTLVEQHHYLGHKIPFGAHLRYLVESDQGVLGCLQYSSPAWRLQGRDRWIGWDERQRRAELQQILCNSRFLVLPWVHVPNLASHILSRSAHQVADDWLSAYGVRPLLLESIVDGSRYRGTCYRAANWIHVGESSGRGRNDRHHQHHGESPKQIWIYPLNQQSRQELLHSTKAG